MLDQILPDKRINTPTLSNPVALSVNKEMLKKISETQPNSEISLLHKILFFTKNTKIFKGISRLLTLILVFFLILAWALLAALALLLTLGRKES